MDDAAAGGTVVLTGATGFIGSHLQAKLLTAGFRVRALLRPGSARTGKLLPDVEHRELDLTSTQIGTAAMTAIADTTAIIYCAGSVRGKAFEDFEPANVRGVRNIARAAAGLLAAPPMLLLSSLAASQPQLSDYAASKLAGEAALQEYPSVPWTILRPPAVYGPGDKEMRPVLDLVRRGLTPVIGPSSQRLSLIHVEDLTTAVIAWLAHTEACEHATYALDDGHADGYGWDDITAAAERHRSLRLKVPRRLLEAIGAANKTLAGLMGYAPMLTPGKVRELYHEQWLATDNEAFRECTGWTPNIGLSEGMARLDA